MESKCDLQKLQLAFRPLSIPAPKKAGVTEVSRINLKPNESRYHSLHSMTHP